MKSYASWRIQAGRGATLGLIEQCLGIAKGLQKIHSNPLTEAEAKARDLKPDTPRKRHGRHGDLKPENILYFLPQADTPTNDDAVAQSPQSLQPILRISDFGFADFYGTNSKSKMEKRGMTGTYRAPEWEIHEYVAPAYDLWCMGCIFLEFVEWYLCGAKGIDDFINKRLSDSDFYLSDYAEDSFFNCIQTKLNERGARAKKSVKEVSSHHHLMPLRYLPPEVVLKQILIVLGDLSIARTRWLH